MNKITERKKLWVDFLDMGIKSRHMFLINYEPDILERPFPWPNNIKERTNWSFETYERAMARLEWLEDDYIPCLDVFTGTEIFAQAFGCRVHYPEDNMPFALPLIHNASEIDKVKDVELDSSSLTVLFEMADELIAKAGKNALLKMVDIQSPMDITALIWDKNDFYLALIETPEAVKEVVEKVKRLLMEFLDRWYERYGKSFISHCPYFYMPQGITLSEDEVGVVSGEMFNELFLPELVELSNRYGGIGIHCCANSRHQWNNFLNIPGLKYLNICQPPAITTESISLFARHCAQSPFWMGDGDPWTWPSQYPEGSKMVIYANAATKEEALRAAEKLSAACSIK